MFSQHSQLFRNGWLIVGCFKSSRNYLVYSGREQVQQIYFCDEKMKIAGSDRKYLSSEHCRLIVLGARVAQWVRSLDLTTHTSLSPIRRGFAPIF
jgi:hypothetical protein